MYPHRSLAIVCFEPPGRTETFITAHVDHLQDSVLLTSTWRPTVDGRSVLGWPRLAAHKGWRMISGAGIEYQRKDAFVRAFRRYRTEVVLAEYGPAAVHVLPACRELGVPLVAHFHGYDATHRGVLAEFAAGYASLFRDAASLVVVSRAMRDRLMALGAPASRIHYNSYGVDAERFVPAPAGTPRVALSVGRFVEKKAPHLVIEAFAAVARACPEAQLRMAGDGPLLESSRALVCRLGLDRAVTFLGSLTPDRVAAEMRAARVFVQHSIEAPSGDCEGTPLSILEAGASGLPVVATHHGGIPDVVLDGATGFLVAEGDVRRMGARLTQLMSDTGLAAALGQAARRRVSECFSLAGSLRGLSRILETARRDRARESSVA